MHRFYTPLLLLLGSVVSSNTATENEQSTLLAHASTPGMKSYGSSSTRTDERIPNTRRCACALAPSRLRQTGLCALLLAGLTSFALLHQCPWTPQQIMLRVPITPVGLMTNDLDNIQLPRHELDINNISDLDMKKSSAPTIVFRTKPVAFGLWDKIALHKEHALDIYSNDDDSPCYRITPLPSSESLLTDASGAILLKIVQTTESSSYNYQSMTFQIRRYDVRAQDYTTLYDVVQKDTWGDIAFLIASDERLNGPDVVAVPVGGQNSQIGYQLKVMSHHDTIAELTGNGDFRLLASRSPKVEECVYVAMAKILELYKAE